MTRRWRIGMVFLAALAAMVVGGLSLANASSRPPWIATAVLDIRRMFVGMPKPVRVRWNVGAKKRWVTVRFAKVELCGGCSAPTNSALPRGRVATMWFDRRTGRETDFGVTR